MAMMEVITNKKVIDLFENLEEQKNLITKCTDLYNTLSSYYISVEESLNSKTQTLDSKFRSLNLNYQKSLEDLQNLEHSIPNRFSSLSSEIESKKNASIAELRKPLRSELPVIVVLKSLCRRMDCSGLMQYLLGKRKDKLSLRSEMEEAIKECVDPEMMVMGALKDFMEAKSMSEKRLADKLWACGVVVSGLFSLEKFMEKKGKEAVFAKKTVAESEKVMREWRKKAEEAEDREESEGKMGTAEVAMFLLVIIGFGLREIFEEEFYMKMIIEFSGRKDMAKFAIPILKDKIPDLIDRLIQSGKLLEAVDFALESGLTGRFQPVSLLNTFLSNSQKNTTEILEKGNHSADAKEEADKYEATYIRSIITCVVDNNLEAEFSIENLKKRLFEIEKARADKKAAINGTRPSKRAQGIEGSRNNGAPPPRPMKRSKYPSRDRGERASQAPNRVSRYRGPYNLPNQTAYNPGVPASTYGPRYGAYVPTAHQIPQQHYGPPGGSALNTSAVPQPQLVGSYGSSTYGMPGGGAPTSAEPLVGSHGSQSVYGAYNYGVTNTSYQPPYAQ